MVEFTTTNELRNKIRVATPEELDKIYEELKK